MPYHVEIRSSVRSKIISWNLPDFVLVEVYLRLREELADSLSSMRRATVPFDGMIFHFSLVDPQNRLCEHIFDFLVQYSRDEEALIIVNGGYVKRVGM